MHYKFQLCVGRQNPSTVNIWNGGRGSAALLLQWKRKVDVVIQFGLCNPYHTEKSSAVNM